MAEQSEIDKLLGKYREEVNESEGPAILIKDGKRIYQLTEARLKELCARMLEICTSQSYDDFNKAAKIVSLVTEVKKAWYPATQKSINTNINEFDKSLEKWYILQKELIKARNKKELEEKEPITYEIVSDK